MQTQNQFGEYFKARRKKLGLTLRRFCLENGLDPGNISKIERGRARPPQGQRLEHYAQLLQLENGSDEWYEFFDLAAAARGQIPEDLCDEEVVDKLPILFRTLRGQKVPDEQLEELVRLLRKT